MKLFLFKSDPLDDDIFEIQSQLNFLYRHLNKNGTKFQKAEKHASERAKLVSFY